MNSFIEKCFVNEHPQSKVKSKLALKIMDIGILHFSQYIVPYIILLIKTLSSIKEENVPL